MFVVIADQACTANIYTHEFNIACMHATKRLLFRESLFNSHSTIPSKYLLYIYVRYATFLAGSLSMIFLNDIMTRGELPEALFC